MKIVSIISRIPWKTVNEIQGGLIFCQVIIFIMKAACYFIDENTDADLFRAFYVVLFWFYVVVSMAIFFNISKLLTQIIDNKPKP